MSSKKTTPVPAAAIAAVALVLAIGALAAAIAAGGDERPAPAAPMHASSAAMPGMAGMSGEDMEHMQSLPMKGISSAPSDAGGTVLEGKRRDGALGHCPLYARLGHVPRSLKGAS